MTRQMKDSGVEWIGEIPEDWDILQLKYVSKITTGGKNTIDRDDDGAYPFFVRSPKIERIDSFSFDGEAILTAGDGVGAGKVFHYFNGKFDYHQRVYNIYSFDESVNAKYIFYYLQNNFMKVIEASNAKSTVDSIRMYMLTDMPLALPTKNSQDKIVEFLDRKLNEIDTIIAKSKQAIEEYKRYKQALITKVITKGLDKTTCLKDSGIDWIGAIPEKWKTAKLKYLVEQPLKYGANSSGCEFKEELPRYIRITDISKDNKLIDTGKLSIDLSENSEFILQDGDILFARSGATVGKTFYYKKEMGVSGFAGYLIRARINDNNLSKYIYYITLSSYYEKWKDSILIQATIENVGADKYNNLIATVPPIKEQKEIVIYLDEKTSQIDEIIAKKVKLVEEMEAYKKSLIFETVTGKREVD